MARRLNISSARQEATQIVIFLMFGVILSLGLAENTLGGVLPAEFSAFPIQADDQAETQQPKIHDLEAKLAELTSQNGGSRCNRNVINLRLQLAELRWTEGELNQAETDYFAVATSCIECLPIEDSLRIKAQYALSLELEAQSFYSVIASDRYLLDALAGCNGSDWCKGKIRALLLRQVARTTGLMGEKMSRDLFRESLRIFEEMDTADSAEVAMSLWLLRRSLFEGLERQEAHQILDRLLKLHESRPGLKSPTRASVLSAYGEDLHVDGDDASALQFLRNAAEMQSLEGAASGCRFARTQALIAECLTNLARFDEAKPYFESAIDTYAACGEVNPPYFFVSVSAQYGKELINHGDFRLAERILFRAAEIARDSLPLTEDAHLYLLLELARLYDLTGRIELAGNFYYRALTMAEMIHPIGDPRVSNFLEPYAEFCFEQGDYKRALPMQARAQKLWEGTLGANHPATSISTGRLSLMLRRSFDAADWSGGVSAARVLQVRAWRARFDQYMEALTLLTEYQLVRLASALQSDASHMYSMIAEMPPESDEANSVGIDMPTLKSLVWEVPYARQRAALTFTDTYCQTLADSLLAVRTALARLYIRTSFTDGGAESRKRFDELSYAKRRLSEELIARHQGTAISQVLSNCNGNGIASVLPKESAVVDYVRYEHDISLRKTETRYLAYIIRPDSSNFVVPLGHASTIDSLVALYSNEVSREHGLDEIEYSSISHELFDLVWKPIQMLLGGAHFVFLGPDGLLNRIAFESLINDSGAYLVESFRFQYISSAREVNRIFSRSNAPSQTGKGLFVIGDSDFDAALESVDNSAITASIGTQRTALVSADRQEVRQRSGLIRESMHGISWGPLPATRDEAISIAQAWQVRSGETTTLMLRSDASEENFKQYCRDKRVLYVATHGFTLSKPLDKQVYAENGTDDYSELIAEQSPLLKSGLVFSGANKLLSENLENMTEDGIATGEEISCMNLDGVELVVLSACHSGQGDVVNGEGVYSLRRAFEIAGAKTVVSSLWAVDDNMTRDLMKKTIVDEDVTIGEALHNAMLSRIRELREQKLSTHPYFWAGFVCSGDPRTKLFQNDHVESAK